REDLRTPSAEGKGAAPGGEVGRSPGPGSDFDGDDLGTARQILVIPSRFIGTTSSGRNRSQPTERPTSWSDSRIRRFRTSNGLRRHDFPKAAPSGFRPTTAANSTSAW